MRHREDSGNQPSSGELKNQESMVGGRKTGEGEIDTTEVDRGNGKLEKVRRKWEQERIKNFPSHYVGISEYRVFILNIC